MSLKPSVERRFSRIWLQRFPDGSVVKNPPFKAGDAWDSHSIPGSRRCPGEGNGNPLQYFCLGNPMDRGAWWATVHRDMKSLIGLRTCTEPHSKCSDFFGTTMLSFTKMLLKTRWWQGSEESACFFLSLASNWTWNRSVLPAHQTDRSCWGRCMWQTLSIILLERLSIAGHCPQMQCLVLAHSLAGEDLIRGCKY